MLWSMNDTVVVRPRRGIPPLALLVRPRVTITAIAKAAGVTPGYVSRVLTGERPASQKLKDAATRLLGMSEQELFG